MSTATSKPFRSDRGRRFKGVALLLLTGTAAVLAVGRILPPTTVPALTGPSYGMIATNRDAAPAPVFLEPAATTAPSTDPVGVLQSRVDAAFDLETRAYTTQKESDYRAAADAFEACAAADPENLQVRQSLGYLWLEKLNDPGRALPHLEKAFAIAPEETDWSLVLAKAAGELGKTDRQLEVLRDAHGREPASEAVKRALAAAESAATRPATTRIAATEPAPAIDTRPPALIAARALEARAYVGNTRADYLAAADALENYSRTDPDNLKVRQSLGYLCLEKLNDAGRAYPHLEKAYALAPDQSDWAMVLAKAAGELGKTDRQTEVLREVLKRDPGNPEARGALAALTATTQATAPPVAPPVVDKRANDLAAAFALESDAYTSNSKSDFQAAADAMEKCSRANPNDLKLERSVGYIYLEKLSDPHRAYWHLEQAYTLAPGDSEWSLLLAQAAGEAGRTKRQGEVLRESLRRDPGNADLQKALAEADGTAAPADTQPADTPAGDVGQKSELDAAFALEARAYTSNAKADFQSAADALEKCSKDFPDNAKVEQSVGFIWLEKLKDSAKAYPHLEKAYALTPGDSGWGSLLARAAGETGRGGRQLEVLADVAKKNPGNAGALVEYGLALEKAGKHDEAEKQFKAAEKLAPRDENVLVPYGKFLHTRGADVEAKNLADRALEVNPKSAGALALEGDIHRNDWDLDQARAMYQQALAADPENESARLGVTEIHKSSAPTFDSSYYYFKGTDHFMQQGLYDTLSFSTSSHIYENVTYNMGYFKDNQTRDPSVIRYQEGIGIEDRIDSDVSLRGGLEAFQIPRKQAFGYNLGVTWRPTSRLWIDGTYRADDPVNDSMYTVANGFSQDILGFGGGYQFSDDLALKFAASRSVYSDDATREYIHIEPAYTVWQEMQLKLGVEYETVRYSKQIPGAGGLDWYQTYGPVVELEPAVTGWLSVHFRGELPYVEEASQFGSNLNLDLIFRPGRHVEAKLGVFYVHVPESISSYSGSGFDASISFRF